MIRGPGLLDTNTNITITQKPRIRQEKYSFTKRHKRAHGQQEFWAFLPLLATVISDQDISCGQENDPNSGGSHQAAVVVYNEGLIDTSVTAADG